MYIESPILAPRTITLGFFTQWILYGRFSVLAVDHIMDAMDASLHVVVITGHTYIENVVGVLQVFPSPIHEKGTLLWREGGGGQGF